MRKIVWLCYFVAIAGFAQESYSLKESKKAQEKLNEAYLNPETSILLEEDFEEFMGLEFFPIVEKGIVKAKFIRTRGEVPFEMPTTTERVLVYVKYAEVQFTIDNEILKLNAY